MGDKSITNRQEVTFNNHPQFDELKQYWVQMRDTVELGEKKIKDKGTTYLPKTEGQKADGDSGNYRYNSYKQRAIYINFGKRTLKKSDGLLNSKPYVIELPEAMKDFIDSATIDGESLDSLIRLINKEWFVS